MSSAHGPWRSSSSSSSSQYPREVCSYKLITATYGPEWDYEGEKKFCGCNLVTPRRTSWTELNPGRRFYGCAHFPKRCQNLEWHDPMMSDRARDVILELICRERKLLSVTNQLQHQVSNLKRHAVDLVQDEIIEENIKLKNELEELRLKLNLASQNCNNGESNSWLTNQVDDLKFQRKQLVKVNHVEYWKGVGFVKVLVVSFVIIMIIFNTIKPKSCVRNALPDKADLP